jgi:uncharacterized membrane protein YgaE (UPF0421/DUF939 family)
MMRLSASLSRLVDSLLPIIQIVAAVVAAYSIAHFGLGHATPMLAATVTISSLGFARDARPSRVLESALGMVVGITVSEGILLAFGTGVWQIAVALTVTLAAARLLSQGNAFAVVAGVQSMLVIILPAPPGGPFVRIVDGLIGGAVALLVTALIPRDPRRLARRDAARLFAVFLSALGAMEGALRSADEPAARRALDDLRRTQPLVDAWAVSLETATSIARISPFLRRYVAELDAQRQVLRGMDFATRNLRVIARRIDFLVLDGQPRPALASMLATIATSVTLLSESLNQPVLAGNAQAGLAGTAAHLDPAVVDRAAGMSDATVVLMLRPLLVDLLVASGLEAAKARALLPEV